MYFFFSYKAAESITNKKFEPNPGLPPHPKRAPTTADFNRNSKKPNKSIFASTAISVVAKLSDGIGQESLLNSIASKSNCTNSPNLIQSQSNKNFYLKSKAHATPSNETRQKVEHLVELFNGENSKIKNQDDKSSTSTVSSSSLSFSTISPLTVSNTDLDVSISPRSRLETASSKPKYIKYFMI